MTRSTINLPSVHAASLRDRDCALGVLWPDQIDQFAKDAAEKVGRPAGRGARLFRVGNELYARGRKAYVTRIAAFFDGWACGRNGELGQCEQYIDC